MIEISITGKLVKDAEVTIHETKGEYVVLEIKASDDLGNSEIYKVSIFNPAKKEKQRNKKEGEKAFISSNNMKATIIDGKVVFEIIV